MIRALAALLLTAASVSAQTSGEFAAEPTEYRMDAYRGPVPETLSGATVVDDAAAYALWRTDRVVFIDVLPRAPKPTNLPAGTIWREKKRFSIPGAIWLPNVGYGAIASETDAYFRHHLREATAGDRGHPVLFFCLAGCWMSWNAAKRALEYGYTRVFWYPDGSDGWDFAAYPLEPVERAPH
ncbi:MAG: PQQ-dependent catabolism-associated CXXCW motif protein [Pseudomonadota bacterium]